MISAWALSPSLRRTEVISPSSSRSCSAIRVEMFPRMKSQVSGALSLVVKSTLSRVSWSSERTTAATARRGTRAGMSSTVNILRRISSANSGCSIPIWSRMWSRIDGLV
jgi:hypothetical protein